MPARYVVRALEAMPDGTSLRYVGAVVLALVAYVGFTLAYYVFGFNGLLVGVVVIGVGSLVGRYAKRPQQALAGAFVIAVLGTVAVWTLVWALSVVYVVDPTSVETVAVIGLITLIDVVGIFLGAFSGYVAV